MTTAPETLDLLTFLDDSPTPWHCAATSARRLEAAGFSRLAEDAAWDIQPGARHYLVRDGLVVAFHVGQRPPHEAGFRLVGAHTDSPNLRVKPVPDVARAGYRQLGVEVYGGALYYTWLDRDLGLAGRAFVRGDGPAPEPRLVDLRRPLLRIPSLAIHLQREVNDGLKLNPQQHLPPVLGQLGPSGADSKDGLQTLLAPTLGVTPDAILGWDLALVDVVPATLGGWADEFVFAGRLDNQAMSHAALTALVRASAAPADVTRVIALYDHEEVGSLTTAGADGPIVERALARIAGAPAWGPSAAGGDALARAAARSWHVSADMAHAVHPNFEDKHEPQHRPSLNGGPVIKLNSNQRYATSGEGAAFFAALCADVDVPVQRFVTRTDLACGTTIGPIAAGRLGVRTVDVGNPMWSMHSIREQAGAHDVPRMIAVLTRLFA
ncbi:MAG: M18 family aminopeptidase [Deltaproteobacteria bacterium]|nr:M18 family aminopeptidase [Deltaproteobacteria bacterium]